MGTEGLARKQVAGGWRIWVGVARRMRAAGGAAALCGRALGRSTSARQRKQPPALGRASAAVGAMAAGAPGAGRPVGAAPSA